MTLASGELAIAICDRCKRKRPYTALRADGNAPGLRVCADDDGCYDSFDPYRLPPKSPDPIAMRFARPDVPLRDDRTFMITENGEWVEVVPPPGEASP